MAKKEFPIHEENPFMMGLQIQTSKKKVEIKGKGDSFGIINYTTGESNKLAGFFEVKEYDKQQFVKIFADGIAGLIGLSSSGLKVFKVIYDRMLENPKDDKIILDSADIKKSYPALKMSDATFSRGMTEVLRHGFIARSHISNVYYVNPKYIFNGDRVQFVKEYRWKDHPNQVQERKQRELEQDNQGDLFSQDIETKVEIVD